MKKWILLIVLLIKGFNLFAQTDTEFWFVAPEADANHGDNPIFLRIAGTGTNGTVTVTQPANPNFATITQPVPANGITSINLTARIADIENNPANVVLNKGLFIQSSVNVTAYYEIADDFNPEIFPLKGLNALGQQFYIPSQNIHNNQFGNETIDIVATEDGTTITITPTDDIVGHLANVPFTIVLNRGETFSCQATNIQANAHLGGTLVIANKPIAVTISDDSIFKLNAWDIIGDQLVPTDILGTKYIAVNGFGTNEVVFVTATEDLTQVFVDGNPTPVATLNQGDMFNIPINNNAVYIESDKPIYTYHLSGHVAELGSAILPPIECTGSRNVSFVRPGANSFSMMVLTQAVHQNSFELNGNNFTLNFTPVPGNPNWVSARIDPNTATVPTGANRLGNTSGLFHLGILYNYNLSSEYGYFSNYSSLNIGVDAAFCQGDSITLDAGENRSSILWNTGDTSRFLTIKDEGIYWVQANYFNCQLTDTIDLDMLEIEVDLQADTIVCPNETLTIVPTVVNAATYLWQDDSDNSTFTTDSVGTYIVEVRNSDDCPATDTMIVQHFDLLDSLFVEDNLELCTDETYDLIPIVTRLTNYNWQDNSSDTSFTITTDGLYSLSANDSNGCVIADSVTANYLPNPEPNLPNDTTLCEKTSITLYATQPFEAEYQWTGESIFFNQNDYQSDSFIVSLPGTYTVEVSNICSGFVQDITIEVENCGCDPYVPNVFTPNQDGINDEFEVFANCEIQQAELWIFDRWGNNVFHTNAAMSDRWNGTFKGQECANAVYVWQLIYDAPDENGQVVSKLLKGDVTLVR